MVQCFSPIIAGTMFWGQWGRKLNTEEMADLIRHCIYNKITSFDHADIYGGYTNEADFGEAFVRSGVQREKIQLISKCGIQLVTPNRNNRIHHYNYNKNHIISSCEKSLQNLRTEYLDLFLIHRPSPLMEAEIIAEAASTLKEQGKILSFGLSNFTPIQTELVMQHTPVHYNQIEFSLTHHLPMTDGSLHHMMKHHIVPMAWAPLGIIFKEETPQTKRILKVMKTMTKKYEVDIDILMMGWIMKHPAHILPVAGTTDKLRISRLQQAFDLDLDLEDWFELWEASMGAEVP